MTNLQRCFAQWLESQWYGSGRVGYALRPLGSAFSLVAQARRWAYRTGVEPVERLPVPVIVVGNLTVGGTGKTPLTIWLADFLRSTGYRPGVISRGYGGAPDRPEPFRVQPDSDPALCGDEPVLIALRTSVPVIVGRDRVAAARALLDTADCDVLIADDGLQHYRLGRDIEILLVDGERRFGNGWCLPAGPLREPVQRADTVDFVVCRGGTPCGSEYAMAIDGEIAHNLLTGAKVQLVSFAGTPVHALAGIANPRRFFRDLRAAGLAIEPLAFPDHHPFRAQDLSFADDKPVLMTEKDAVKCRKFANEKLWCVPVAASLPPELGRDLLQRLRRTPHG